MTRKRILLIDADVLAYEAASACEVATEFEDNHWTWHCDFDEVRETFDANLKVIVDTLEGDEVKLCLTDSLGNFRFNVLPTYKGNRKSLKKPLVLMPFKKFLIEERAAYFKPTLEGDDCMGILATMKMKGDPERVIVSIDKDMKTIPGLVCRWPIEKEPRLISEAEADYWHLYQTLTGDTCDGYAGCPGIGPKKAVALIADGGTITRVEPEDHGHVWRLVVAAYEKAGLTEADALQQARVARILRASDYDFTTKAPILWTPKA